jgi:hypothetical protein
MARLSREVRVFGDDMIVPLDAWPLVCDMLSALGLKVNTDKTFGTGKFRESCGVDAYDGHLVSKVGVLRMPQVGSPESVLSSVDVHNNFLMGGYENTARLVRSTVTRFKQYVFPEVAPLSGLCGWYAFGDLDYTYLSSRWNPDLHRREYLCTQPRGRVHREPAHGNLMMLQYFTEVKPGLPANADRLGFINKEPSTTLSRRWVSLVA